MSELSKAVKAAVNSDPVMRRCASTITKGRGTFGTAGRFATRYGDILSKELTKAYAGAEYITEAEAMSTVAPVLESAYRTIARESAYVQKTLNTAAGIPLNGIVPNTNKDRIINFAKKLASAPLKDTDWLFGEDCLENFTQSAVTDTIHDNAEFQEEAGLRAYIERDAGGGCCAWCDSLAGRYEYGNQPDDFFKVHKDCTCEIIFEPSKGSWTRTTYYRDDDGELRRNTESF